MWTYRHPYREPLTASERIQYHAHAELFRAMNIGRQIAFVGSGVSLAYGHLTWNEMVLLVVNAVDQRYRINLIPEDGKIEEWKAENSSADRLHSSLRQQFKKKSLHNSDFKKNNSKKSYYKYEPINALYSESDFNSTTLLALCTDLSKAMDEESFVKTFIADLFQASPLKLFLYRLFLLRGAGKRSLFHLFCMSLPKSMCAEKLDEATLPEILDKIEKTSLSTGNIEDSIQKLKRDAPEIFQMGHLELEIHIWDKLKAAYSDLNRSSTTLHAEMVLGIVEMLACFDQIVNKSAGPNPIKVLSEDWGIKRFVTTNYDLEIEKYFVNSAFFSPQAQHDNIFSKHTDKDINPFIAENGYGGKLISSSISSHNIGDLVDFSVLTIRDNIQVLHIHGRMDQPDDLVITEYDYQNLYLKNHVTRRTFDESVRTLFAGNDVVFVGLGMSETDILRPMREFMSDGQNTAKHRDGIVSLLNQRAKEESKTQSLTISLKTQYDINSVLYANEQQAPSYPKGKSVSRTRLLRYMIENRKQALQSTIEFENALRRLAVQQRRWWYDLILAPDGRVSGTTSLNGRYAIYHCEYVLPETSDLSQDAAKKDLSHMVKWSRRTLIKPEIFNTKTQSVEGNPAVSNIKRQISATRHLIEPRGRRAIIVAGDAGVGKGTFVSSLQEKHFNLFNNNGFRTVHAFHGDPRYTSDFNSVISALTRFIAGRLRSLQILKKNPHKTEFDEEDAQAIRKAEKLVFDGDTQRVLLDLKLSDDIQFGRFTLLEKLLLRFGELAFKFKHRIFICLSYLDHLSDEKGWEYNKLHRRFIQLLTSKKLKDIPLDIVFVTSASKPLIMSLQQAKSIPSNNKFLMKRLSFSDRIWLDFPFFQNNKSLSDIDDIVASNGETSTAYIREIAKEHLSIHMALRSLVYEYLHAGENEINNIQDVPIEQLKYLQQVFRKLNFHASQKNIQKVLSTILTAYEYLDTQINRIRDRPPIFRAILHRLAFFSGPIERNVIASCPDIVDLYSKFSPGSNNNEDITERRIAEWLENYISILHSRGLLIKTLGGRIRKSTHTSSILPSSENDRYVLHSLLRNHLEKKMDYSIFESGEHSFYDVSLYMTQPRHLPKPKDTDYVYLGKTLKKLIDDSRKDMSLIFQYDKCEEGPDKEKIRERIIQHFENLDTPQSPVQRLRAARNLIAHAFSIGVISRLGLKDEKFDLIGENNSECPFENYESWTRGILNAATGFAHLRKDMTEILKEKFPDLHLKQPFYATEIAWLYNERALVNFVQGRLYDALPLFELALDGIKKQQFTDNNRDFHKGPSSSYRRVLLNKALARLEFGKISEARSDFEMLSGHARKNVGTEEHTRHRLTDIIATGYLGLCDHLTSRLDTAGKYYEMTLDMLEDMPHRLRTKAIFLKLQADLEQAQGNYIQSETLIDESIRAAISVEQQDILHHSLVSKALIIGQTDSRSNEAFELLRKAETYAERLGLPKLTVDAANIRARLYIRQGQLDSVGNLLTTSIAICNKNGMTLRKIAALNIYGHLLELREDAPQLAQRVLNFSDHLAEKTGYMSRAHSNWRQVKLTL